MKDPYDDENGSGPGWEDPNYEWLFYIELAIWVVLFGLLTFLITYIYLG